MIQNELMFEFYFLIKISSSYLQVPKLNKKAEVSYSGF